MEFLSNDPPLIPIKFGAKLHIATDKKSFSIFNCSILACGSFPLDLTAVAFPLHIHLLPVHATVCSIDESRAGHLSIGSRYAPDPADFQFVMS